MSELEEDDISVEELIAREAARVLYGSRIFVEPQPLNQSTEEDVFYMEPSSEALRQQQELMRDCEDMMLRGMQAFRVSSQRWEICTGNPGLCTVEVNGSMLEFPLVRLSVNNLSGRVLVKFTVHNNRAGEARTRWGLRFRDGDIFGEVMEWSRHREIDAIDFTLSVHSVSMRVSAQRGEPIRYTFAVPIARYRREEAEVEQSYYQRLERARLLPDRAEAMEELRQEASPQALSVSQPPIKQPTLCKGCRNFHGQYHGGTLLVCGMHPYGNGENCSDFEAR